MRIINFLTGLSVEIRAPKGLKPSTFKDYVLSEYVRRQKNRHETYGERMDMKQLL